MLVGTIALDGGQYATVMVSRRRHERLAAIVIERQRVPGVMCQSVLVARVPDFADAVASAQAVVLSRGGSLNESAEAMSGSPVTSQLARSMFTEIGLRRFVHVPTPEG